MVLLHKDLVELSGDLPYDCCSLYVAMGMVIGSLNHHSNERVALT